MLDAVAWQSLKAEILNHVDKTCEARAHVLRQRRDLGGHRRTEDFHRPAHAGLYSKKEIGRQAYNTDGRDRRLALAGLLVCLPTIVKWLGVLAFGIGVAIYGF